jgi:hypothetical protein
VNHRVVASGNPRDTPVRGQTIKLTAEKVCGFDASY